MAIKQSNSKSPNTKILSINLTHWTMKTTQNVLKNVHYEPWHKQRYGDATDWWLIQQSNCSAFSIRLTVSASFLSDVNKIKRFRWGYYTGFVGNATAVMSSVDSAISPPNFIKMSLVLNTRSSAVAKRPRDASCIYSFNKKRRAQSFIISCFGFRYTTAYS